MDDFPAMFDYKRVIRLVETIPMLYPIIIVVPLPSGKHTKSYGKSPFLMGKSTINGHFQWFLAGNIIYQWRIFNCNV